MPEQTPGRAARLTVRQLDRLRYVAACGPVFRSADDEDLERLQLVRPFNGMPSVVEATTHTAGSELARENIQGAVAALLDACQDALRQFSKGDWCRHGYGCDDCDGCQRYRNLEVAVDAAEPGGLHALHPNWAGERV